MQRYTWPTRPTCLPSKCYWLQDLGQHKVTSERSYYTTSSWQSSPLPKPSLDGAGCMTPTWHPHLQPALQRHCWDSRERGQHVCLSVWRPRLIKSTIFFSLMLVDHRSTLRRITKWGGLGFHLHAWSLLFIRFIMRQWGFLTLLPQTQKQWTSWIPEKFCKNSEFYARFVKGKFRGTLFFNCYLHWMQSFEDTLFQMA